MTEPYAHLCERGLTQESVFRGKILRIRVDTVALPNGEMATREIVEHPGAAAIVPVGDDGRVLLVRQYRYPIDAVTLEVPCGKLEHSGENVADTARRELREETGCGGGELIYLGRMHSAPGFTNEVIHIFAARGFIQGEACADPDEFLEPVWLSIPDALAMIRRGEITDAKTIFGLLWLQQFGLASEQTPPKSGTLDEPEAS
jgi:ADP-ribose pyrophosphatase